ncbi:MAG TPA: peptide chain release factor 1 [Dehalococcoidia bacterium]|nr:peptide chain release factor 1 [Dehalococcoidia bacterium]
MWDRVRALEEKYERLTEEMARPEVAADYERMAELAKERAAIEDVVSLYRQYRETRKGIEDAQAVVAEGDPELAQLAREEIATLTERLGRIEQDIRRALLPKDPHDERDVIVEIRAGEGGDEAALWAADLFRMYTRYADRKGWKVEVLSANEIGIGGLKEVIFEVHGKGAYSRLKYESGGHRVQRVPATEAKGRIHTSAATVAVLPEADEVDVTIDEKDLRIDIFHAGSAGGQNVNKVATAVRITHLPTGLVVVCQDERSQLKNRMKAMAVLRARLLAMKKREQEEEISEARRAQVGTGERGGKIRTYNFPQDRVTDHRIGLTVHGLQEVLDGDLDELIDAVATAEQAKLLQESAA